MPDHYVVRNALEYEREVESYATFNLDRAPIARYLDALCDRVPAGAAVLDLGCGPGWETESLHERGYQAIGFDLSHAFLMHARQEHPADGVVRGDMRRLPFAAGTFAGVWACASMLHLDSADLDVALAEVARVTAPGGAFVGSVQVGEQEAFVPRKSSPGHELFYGYRTPDEWRARVEAVGFAIDDLVAEIYEGEQAHLNAGARGWATAIAIRTAEARNP